MTRSIIKTGGLISLYNGLSAALLRQATYSTARFAFYELSKEYMLNKRRASSLVKKSSDVPFYQKILLAGIGGGIGSIFGKKRSLFC